MKRHDVLASGILVGIAGGAAMLGVTMLAAASREIAAAHPLLVIGESFVGPGAFDAAPAQIAFGALVHLGTSVALGVLFAALVPRDFALPSAVGVGVGFALLALIVMMPFVVPHANPGFREAMHEIGGAWVVGQAVYGLALGMAPALRRWLVREPTGAPVPAARTAPQPGASAATTRTT